MGRGVYARKSASERASAKKPPAASPQPIVQEAPQEPAVQLVAPAFLATPHFYRNKRVAVDAIAGVELKAYARSLGITQRDVDGLTEDRLRQNCKARINQSMED